MRRVDLRVLGPPVVLVDGGPPPPDLEYRKHKALLIYLACSDRWRTRDVLGDLLWPMGYSARSLSQGLVQIRKVLEEAVESEGDMIRLAPGAVHLDADDLQRLTRAGEWSSASALVRGEFCEGLTLRGAPDFEHWLLTQRLAWRETALGVVLRNAERLLDGGEVTAALHEFRRAADVDPLSEAALRGTLRCLALSDQRSTALEEYRLFAERLAESTGGKPSDETRRLAERLRTQAPRRVAPVVADARRPPLVGRTDQLSALRALWASAIAERRPAAALLLGDAGCGKSRLIDEVVARARLEGALCCSIRLLPGDRALPDSGLVGLARGGLLHAPGIAGASPAALAAIASRVPEWAERYPTAPSALPLGEALVQVLRTVGEEHPLLLVIDDAHWCDSVSLLTLETMLRDLAGVSLVLLLALEPTPGNEAIDQLRARLGRATPGRSLRVGPLAPAEVQELAGWALPSLNQEQIDRVVRRICADSAGIPLLVNELLSAVALGLDLGHVNGEWPRPNATLSDTMPGDLPDSVVGALRVGFRRLSPAGQEVLRVLAVCDSQLTETQLLHVSTLSSADLTVALDELEWQRWLQGDARGYDFVARIAKRVIRRDMSTAGQRERILARWRECQGVA